MKFCLTSKYYKSERMQTYAKPTYVKSCSIYSRPTVKKPAFEYKKINWVKCNLDLKKKQNRILQAYNSKDYIKLKVLQQELIRTFGARAMAVKKVLISQKIKISEKEKFKLIYDLRNILEFKKKTYIYFKSKVLQVLIKEQAVQFLFKFATDPIIKNFLEKNCYGYVSNKKVKDCVNGIRLTLNSQKSNAKWFMFLEFKLKSIKKFSHWIRDNMLMDDDFLIKFTETGFLKVVIKEMFNEPLYKSISPENPISSVFSELLFSGVGGSLLTKDLKIFRHVNQFAIFSDVNNKVNKKTIFFQLRGFLEERGLILNSNNFEINKIKNGFEFLGFEFKNSRNNNYLKNFIIKPSQKSLKDFRSVLSKTVKKHKSSKISVLIKTLNFLLRNWVSYFSAISTKSFFAKINNHLFVIIKKFLLDRYKKNKKKEIIKRHYTKVKNNKWIFFDELENNSKIKLFQIKNVKLEKK